MQRALRADSRKPVLSLVERRSSSLRAALSRIRSAFDLSYDQAGRCLRVSGETVRRWETGMMAIPEAQWPAVTQLDQDARRLLHLFEPERLPMVIRRPAELLDGRTALDWIFDGRSREVADRYEAVLLYQA